MSDQSLFTLAASCLSGPPPLQGERAKLLLMERQWQGVANEPLAEAAISQQRQVVAELEAHEIGRAGE